MKRPVALQLVYKVVQVDSKGRMFSANVNRDDLFALSKQPKSDVVQYKFNYQIFPQEHLKCLFVCKTLEEANRALSFYTNIKEGRVDKATRILHCLAFKLREFDFSSAAADKFFIRPMFDFRSFVCDSLVPLETVKELKVGQKFSK